jgi:nitrogen PTS system EIIA component
MQLAVRDAAGILNVSEKTIYRWIKEGRLPAYRVAEQYRFNRAELLEWATARKINVSPGIFQEPEGSHTALPTLVEALQTGGIHYRISGVDKQAVLRSVVDVMRLPDSVNREFLLQVLLARESLGSTGIGDGIAIPHVRNPIVLHIATPTITLCFLEHAIDFGAIDGKPVNILFTIISPTIRAHLHLLSNLAFVLRDGTFKAVLMHQESRDEILQGIRLIETRLAQSAVGTSKETQ